MATAVFLTYNSVGKTGTFPNGAVTRGDNTAVIVQHPKGEEWGASKSAKALTPDMPICLNDCRTDAERQELDDIKSSREGLVRELYSSVFNLADVPDYVVVYVGTGGSEGAIHLAAQLPKEKVRFVLCDCNLPGKLGLIATYYDAVPYLMCECGGQRTMEKVVNDFLSTGAVGSSRLAS